MFIFCNVIEYTLYHSGCQRIIFFEIKGRSTVMSYKKKMPHIKGNEAKPYYTQFNRKNRAKINTTLHHHTLGEESTRNL